MLTAVIPHNQFFDIFFSFLSLRGNSIVIWAIVLSFLIIFEEKRNKRFIVSFIISILVVALVVQGIKILVRRPRPSRADSDRFQLISTDYNCPNDFSFPSGHAATAFAAATIIAHYDKKRKWFYYLVASLIGLSRMYLGCHYFLDVAGGGLIGYSISVVLLRLEKLR